MRNHGWLTLGISVLTGLGSCSVPEETYQRIVDANEVPDGNGSGSFASPDPSLTPIDHVEYPTHSIVALTPTPMTGSTFAGWSGDCLGMVACEVTMDRARHVVATFTFGPSSQVAPGASPMTGSPSKAELQTLTLETAGTGAGRVTAVVLAAEDR